MDLMAARRFQEEQVMKTTAEIQHNYRSSDYPLQWGWVAERKTEEERKEEKESSSSDCIRKEHMFDKVVTPSDVGKLNRLVIPKQHAEKYFPLDSSSNEKGLLLNFEDRGGKPWRFRYSYWNSSQSYVMTKGWSRFVKEKKLDPGDTVSFHRAVGDLSNARLYIDWRRRRDAAVPLPPHLHLHRSLPWVPILFRHPPPPPPPSFHWDDRLLPGHGRHLQLGSPACTAADSMYYIGRQTAAQVVGGGGSRAVENEAGRVPVARAMASAVAPKRFRLFGVDVECALSEEDECVASAEASSSLPPRQKGKERLCGYNLDLEI